MLKPVGFNFKSDKRGVRVCIPFKRGMCNLGDRCCYSHDEPGHQKNNFQVAVDQGISPLEVKFSPYVRHADNFI